VVSKILGLSENAHKGIGALFLMLFLLGVLSSTLSISQGDPGNAAYVMGSCTVVGLLPAIIFLYFGVRLQKERMALQALAGFLYQKQRTSVREAAQQFGWTDQVTEERIVAALGESIVQGHFDRGTKEFFVLGSQQNMVFVERCRSCGASVGMWLRPDQPAKCPYCGTDPRGAPPPAMPAPPLQPAMGAGPASAATGQPAPPYYQPTAPSTPPSGAGPVPPAAPQQPAQPAPAGMQPMAPPGQPAYAPYATPYPPTQTVAQAPPVSAAELSMQQAQTRRTPVKFLFFSLKSSAMKTAGFILLGIGLLFVGAAAFMPAEGFGRGELLVCSGLFYLPMLLIGSALVWKAYVHDRYIADLLDVVDYIVTYRQISFQTLAQKMNMPEQRAWQIVYDILKFNLIDGQITPDGREFATKLRPEDTQSVVACPYCRHPANNVQVIRGGSEKCPYCKAVIYFIEGARR